MFTITGNNDDACLLRVFGHKWT